MTTANNVVPKNCPVVMGSSTNAPAGGNTPRRALAFDAVTLSWWLEDATREPGSMTSSID